MDGKKVTAAMRWRKGPGTQEVPGIIRMGKDGKLTQDSRISPRTM